MGLAWSHIPALLLSQWTCTFPSADSFPWRGTGSWQPWGWPRGHTMVLGPRPCLRKALTSHLSAWQHLKPASKCAEGDFGQPMETAGWQQRHWQPGQNPSKGLKNQYIPAKWGQKPPVGFKMADESRVCREMKVRGKEAPGAVSLHPLSCFIALLSFCTLLQFCFPAPSTTPNRHLQFGAVLTARCSLHLDWLLPEPEMGKLVLHPPAWLSASPWQPAAAPRCAVTFWGTRQEISSWLK